MSLSKRLKPGLFALFIALNLFVCGAINLAAPSDAAAGEVFGPGQRTVIIGGSRLVTFDEAGESKELIVNGLNGEDLEAIDFDLTMGFLGLGIHVIGVGEDGGIFGIGPDGNAQLLGRIPPQFLGDILDIDINPINKDIFIANERGQLIKFNPREPNTFRIVGFVYDKDDPNTGKKGIGVMTFTEKGAFLIDLANKVLAQITNIDFGLMKTVGSLNLGNFSAFGFDTNPVTDQSIASIITAGQQVPDLYQIDTSNGQATRIDTMGTMHKGLTLMAPPLKNFHCVVTPPHAVNKVGTEHTFNVEIFDGDTEIGNAHSLSFKVLAGPNAGQSGSVPLSTFSYTSNGMAGIDTVIVDVAFSGNSATCRATKEWVTTPHISAVEKNGKKLTITGQFDKNGNNKVIVNGKEQKTKTVSETELFSKKGGKKADTDSVVVVDSAGGPSNQFLIGQPPSTLSCKLTPEVSTTRLSDGGPFRHEVKLQVFFNGKLVSEDLQVRFRIKHGPNEDDGFDFPVRGGVFTHTYPGDGQVGFDLIEASGIFKGSPFACFAVKKWE